MQSNQHGPSTGKSTQCSIITFMEKESEKKMDIGICITGSLCYTLEINTTL